MKETLDDISKIKRMFNKWRSRKSHAREPIPESLWRAAADLCSSHPMSTVGQELGLDRKKLRDHVEVGVSGSPRRGPRKRKNRFVTVALPPSGGGALPGGEVACEWIRPVDGARLRMNIGRHEVASVMSAFLGGNQ